MIDIEDQDEKAQAVAAPVDRRLNVKKKAQIVTAKDGKPGTIAHTHKKENDSEEWEEPCYFVEHKISLPEGLRINETDYKGVVIVPQCMADYLAWQETEKIRYEQGIFRSRKINRTVASL